MIDGYVDDMSMFGPLPAILIITVYIVGGDSDETTSFLPPLNNQNKGNPNALDLRTRKSVKKIASASSMNRNRFRLL